MYVCVHKCLEKNHEALCSVPDVLTLNGVIKQGREALLVSIHVLLHTLDVSFANVEPNKGKWCLPPASASE